MREGGSTLEFVSGSRWGARAAWDGEGHRARGAMEYHGAINGGATESGALAFQWQRIEPGSLPDEDTPG
jgi:hypothetical protein